MPINFASLQDPHRQLLIVDDFRSIFIDKRSVVYLLAEPQCVTKLHIAAPLSKRDQSLAE
jgi:hypothetical protein